MVNMLLQLICGVKKAFNTMHAATVTQVFNSHSFSSQIKTQREINLNLRPSLLLLPRVRAHTLPFLYLGLYCGGALIFPQSVHPNFYLSKWSRSSKTASFYLSPSSYSLADCFKIGKEENKNYNPKFLWKSCCNTSNKVCCKKKVFTAAKIIWNSFAATKLHTR